MTEVGGPLRKRTIMRPDSDGSLTRQLAALVTRPVDETLRARARRHLLDWTGIVVAALKSEEGRILTDYVADAPPGTATAVGVGTRTHSDAAFLNAALGLVLELDDVHREAKLHPGPIVVPVALAAGEKVGASVDDVLDGIVRGYEAMIRIGEAAGEMHYRYWHPTSSCGTFGAAAAAASLYGLDEDALVHALGNAGTQSAGLWQCRPERTMSKPLHAGRAARAGLAATELAALGLTGPERILEGELGFFAATCPDAQPERVVSAPFTWRIEECSLKPWPGCRHVHPAMDAAGCFALPDDRLPLIDRIDVRSYRVALDFADLRHPRTPAEARFSLQHAVAYTLVNGRPDISAFDQPAIDDVTVASLRERTHVSVEDELDAAYPAHWGAEVVVSFPDTSQTERVSDALGDPENPMSEKDTVRKARELLTIGGVDPDSVIKGTLSTPGSAPASALLDGLGLRCRS